MDQLRGGARHNPVPAEFYKSIVGVSALAREYRAMGGNCIWPQCIGDLRSVLASDCLEISRPDQQILIRGRRFLRVLCVSVCCGWRSDKFYVGVRNRRMGCFLRGEPDFHFPATIPSIALYWADRKRVGGKPPNSRVSRRARRSYRRGELARSGGRGFVWDAEYGLAGGRRPGEL